MEITNNEIREWLENNKQIVTNPTHIVTAKEAEEKPIYYVCCNKCGIKADISSFNAIAITKITCSCGNKYKEFD